MADPNYDQSHIEKKYFIDSNRYNCPFCNIRNVEYGIIDYGKFDWSRTRKCFYFIVRCSHCKYSSLHLSNFNLYQSSGGFLMPPQHLINSLGLEKLIRATDKDGKEIEDLDSVFFYHQPTSFFTIDNRIPKIIRDLISEADGCRKMDYIIGASGCLRKAIYELLELQKIPKIEKDSISGKEIILPYEDRIKKLKESFRNIDSEYFDILAGIQGMTSDNLHEGSWDSFNTPTLILLIETTKEILYEIYVSPEEKKSKKTIIKQLRENFEKSKLPKQT
ncbi:MAG: hypothetical protein FJZ11_00810 [Candidatus Omnitrophica bacterium]|nr:hypothetical protein [Candidatus Omnitrophota bacterium]